MALATTLALVSRHRCGRGCLRLGRGEENGVPVRLPASAGYSTTATSCPAPQVFDSPVDVDGIPHGVAAAQFGPGFRRDMTEKAINALMNTNKAALDLYHASANTFKVGTAGGWRSWPGPSPLRALSSQHGASPRQQNPLATPIHLLYSETDPITDTEKIRSVAENLRKQGHYVTETVFADSGHVQVCAAAALRCASPHFLFFCLTRPLSLLAPHSSLLAPHSSLFLPPPSFPYMALPAHERVLRAILGRPRGVCDPAAQVAQARLHQGSLRLEHGRRLSSCVW